jgi:hypothetical protein
MMRRDRGIVLDAMRGRVDDHAMRRRDGPAAVAGLAWRALGPDGPTAPQLLIRSMFFAFSVGLYLLNAARPGRITVLYRVALAFDLGLVFFLVRITDVAWITGEVGPRRATAPSATSRTSSSTPSLGVGDGPRQARVGAGGGACRARRRSTDGCV